MLHNVNDKDRCRTRPTLGLYEVAFSWALILFAREKKKNTDLTQLAVFARFRTVISSASHVSALCRSCHFDATAINSLRIDRIVDD